MRTAEKIGLLLAAVIAVLVVAVWLRRKLGGAPSLGPGPKPGQL